VFLLADLESSFDKHVTKRENIYRIYSEFTGVWSGMNHAVPLAVPNALRERATGVEAVSQCITENTDVTIRGSGDVKKFPKPNNIAFVDSNYFKVFPDYRWIQGSTEVLSNPNIVVLTESKAKLYFGENDAADAVGKQITYKDSLEVTVGGVIGDVKENTDFNFTDFISLPTLHTGWIKKEYDFEDWGSTSSQWLCFIRLDDDTPPSKVQDLLATMAKERDAREEAKGEKVTTFSAYKLQPFKDIHFDTKLGTWDSGRSTTALSTIKALVAISLLLLLVAVINFVNLETAQALRRAKEVGLRKVMGGTRASLVTYLVAESLVVTFIAVVIALPLAKLCMMFFSEFLPKELGLNFADPLLWLFVVGLTVIVAVMSGIYPALVLSAYQPAVALKGNRNTNRSGSSVLRRILTVFQFTFSQALIAGAMIIGLQIAWMLNKDLGFSHDAIVTINVPWWEKASKRALLRNELEQLSDIEMISQNSRPPSWNGYSSRTMKYGTGSNEILLSAMTTEGDTSYISLFKIPLIAGRNIQPVDSLMEALINETYCKKLGVDPVDMIGKDIRTGGGDYYHVVGVLKDFHHASLHSSIDPWYYAHKTNSGVFSVRLSKNADLTRAIENMKEAGKKVYGDAEISVTFMDETVEKFYQNERRIAKLANTATALAIFISCLGLLGLASFNAIQRTKEIGIRKVLGASVNNIVGLLSREFIILTLIAFALSVPLAWYGGKQWLDTFPYRMNLGVWIFLVAGALSIVISLITVGFQALKAAIVNPVDSLRYE
jgi:ABC-type antimicrobial peptide transport system permease subunit